MGEKVNTLQYVYGEVVLIENLLINYIILVLTTKISRKKVKVLRLLCASLLGAVYAIFQFYYPIFTLLPFKISLSILIIQISYYPVKGKEFTNLLLIFYVISILLGGCVIALILFNNQREGLTLSIYGVKSTTVALGVILGICGMIRVREMIIDVKLTKESILDISIWIDDNLIHTQGFTDTGCKVLDIITGKPILLVEYHAIEDILPKEVKDYYKEYDDTFDMDIEKKIVDINVLRRVRFVPFNTLDTTDTPYLLCFQTDKVEFDNKKYSHKIDKAYIGICKKKLSQKDEYHALINPKIIYLNGGY